MGGFEETLRRAVAEDREAFQHLRRDLDDIETERARRRAENEAAIREFIAAKARSRDPGLQKWKVKSTARLGAWSRSAMTGWPVRTDEEGGSSLEYFVRDDGEVFSAAWVEGEGGVRTIVNPEPADLGARSLTSALASF